MHISYKILHDLLLVNIQCFE